MRLPDDVVKSVVFLGCRVRGEYKRAATAFLVHGDEHGGWGAVVTARHAIDQVRKFSDDGKVILWLNRNNGKAASVESPVDAWWRHPTDDTVDVAVLPELPPLAEFDQGPIPTRGFATPAFVEEFAIGIGDDLVIPGLFAPHSGTERNLPVVRQGYLAAMPQEPVTTEFGQIRAYLAEVRSIGGVSGSPVLFRNDLWRVVYERNEQPEYERAGWLLLGLMHGHFDLGVPGSLFSYGISRDVVNMGIGIVVPAQHILDVLLQPELDAMRKNKATDARAVATADFLKLTEDVAEPAEPASDSTSEFQAFEDLARKIVNVPKPEIDELRASEGQ